MKPDAVPADRSLLFPFPDPARVLLSGDWHGNSHAMVTDLAVAADQGAGVLVQLGDFGMWPGDGGAEFLQEVSREAQRFHLPVLWVDGNHEDFNQLLALPVDPLSGLRPVAEGVYHIPRGSSWQWAGVRFAALGGATSLDRGMRREGRSWWPQEAVTEDDLAVLAAVGEVDVLLSHDCPSGVDIPGIPHRDPSDRAFPREELERAWDHRDLMRRAAAMARPARIFHGHFHVRYTQKVMAWPGRPCTVTGLGADYSTRESRTFLLDLSQLREELADLADVEGLEPVL